MSDRAGSLLWHSDRKQNTNAVPVVSPALGPGMAKGAYGPASAAADLQVEGPLPFGDGCMGWGAAAEAQKESRVRVQPGRP